MATSLIGCSNQPTKPSAPAPKLSIVKAPPVNAASGGGLYAPHLQDGGPPIPADVSSLIEPVPVVEPLARYGNRSPYTVLGKTYHLRNSAEGYVERGIASWYGTKFHGRPTSSFEPYDMYKFTAAHKTLPLPSFVRVTNLENGRSLIVRVNDRGPFHRGRIIDLSYAAALRLGVHAKGTAHVEVRTVSAAGTEQPPPRQVTSQVVKPATPAAARGPGSHWLQIGSYGQRSNAASVETRLRDAGLSNYRSLQVDVGGRSMWRVQIGPLANISDIDRAQETVRELGFGTPQLVIE
ncbi:MAG: septal ring lytic transglycosylase RlpA family protein [Pseudomarimonas sp.]